MPDKNQPAPENQPAGGNVEADRRAKLDRLRDEFAIDPYGQRTDGLVTLLDARNQYDEAADEAHKADASQDNRPAVKIAGRVVLHRDIGKLVFMTLRDASGDLQVAANKKLLGETAFKLAKLADLGDIVTASGKLAKTKTGEITVWAEGDDGFNIATKSLAPPPEKWSGLKDPELRYRKRYVDLYVNPDVMKTFATRSRIIKSVRDLLTDRGFLEVETPMMQSIAGGAAARPFMTHHNALDIDLFLRIAPELYLKRLLVGGMPKVFEINRNFRNEGIDRSHNPEFTMLELYEAFGDLYSVMDLCEQMIHNAAVMVRSLSLQGEGRGEGEPSDAPATDPHPNPLPERERGPVLRFGDIEINYARPFARVKYHEIFEKANGFPASDGGQLRALAQKLNIDPAGKDHDLLLNQVWEETVEPTLVQPTFVIDYPASLCPLTKRKPDEPNIAERFELFIANMELGNAYTELNDPDVQLANFQQQIAGEDDEDATFRTTDDDFVEALRVGMPPAGGLGVGIDRLVMLLTNNRSIRDVILFPLMRPHS
ncbi:lysine--tRNA ligase [Planctomycetales bacterium ZRK34]|nr:lysine--tRNA ligase [Planctomycetales bacterium ZRK34]